MALTDNLIDNGRKAGDLVCHTAGAEIFLGAKVCHDGTGKVVPAATGLVFAGIADGHANAGEPVKVWKAGVFTSKADATIAPAKIGTEICFKDDELITGTVVATDKCGILEQIEEDDYCYRIDGYAK